MHSFIYKLKQAKVIVFSLFICIITCSISIFLTTIKKTNRLRASKLLFKWAKNLLKQVKATVKIYNDHNTTFDQKRPYIFLANHLSLYDIPASFVALPNVHMRMVIKKELSTIPIFGAGVKSAEFVFIDRHNTKQAMIDLEKTKKNMYDGISVWMSPEGTRSKDGKLGPFKKGPFKLAMETEALIIPLGIRNTDVICKAKTFNFTFKQTAEVYIGKPIDTLEYQDKPIRQLMKQVRQEIAVLSNQEIR